MVVVVDYGVGNLHSVRHALEHIGADVQVSSREEDLRSADRIVLPGVGAFSACMQNLLGSGLVEALAEEVLENGKPLFGICVGMQILARVGLENGEHPGLGWVPAIVKRFEVEAQGLAVPHVGWNEITPQIDSPLFKGLKKTPTFYFVHSYYLWPDDPALIAATCNYGESFTAAIQQRNIFATQFHPEKSQQNGLQLLENFLDWKV
jgi:glutamine amidotransferase